MNKIAILSLLILTSIVTNGQENVKKCITTRLVEQELIINPDYTKGRISSIKENIDWIKANHSKKTTLNIPVVIHIIHKNTHSNIGIGTNISNAQIEDALRILNEDYSKTNPEYPNPPRNTFLNYWGNPNMNFCLANIDPSGNPTNGITRTSTTVAAWDADDNFESNAMKKTVNGGINGWDPANYLNIWVCNLSNSNGGGMTLGYAYLPGLQSWNAWKDGLVIDFQYFGTIDGASTSSDGRTATHEIGHYLGLMHTFCEDSDNQGNPICCDNDNNSWGGNVDDTPATKDIYFGSVTSSTNNNTCNDLSYTNLFTTNVKDMDENFMSYASNTWMFSLDQVNVMNATLNGYRSSLKNTAVSMNCNGSVGTGFNNYQLKNLEIYPNPTLGKLTISSANKINTLSISNIIGKELLFAKYFSANTIDLSSYENGVYFINISTDKGTHIEKIIITK
mgnify:FL=1|tara:strand:- start:212 stop:1561 length:1350 start_codon:yes stop_codon:yes gene_type:complete